MKTAISIPDPVFRAADRLAKNLHVSRSQLYSQAISRFVENHQSVNTTERLNKVYAEDPEASGVPIGLSAMQILSLPREKW
jgi:metal-responsive CopG/Arc/MetJ family transcriptional regulator